MRTFGAVVAAIVCLVVGFAVGFRTAFAREQSRLEHHKHVLRRIHKEVWSNPDLNAAMRAADELYTPDFILHDWTGDSHDLDEEKKSVSENRAAYPDWNEEVLDVVAEGNMVMTRFISTGTQKGAIAEIPGYEPAIPASGKPLRFPELAVHRLVNGKVAEQWDFADNWGANIQGRPY